MNKIYLMFILSFPMMVLAQSPSPSPVASPVSPAAPEGQWLIDLVLHYPKLSGVLFVVGGLRLTLKPLFSFLHQFLPAWGLTTIDDKVKAVEVSKPIKVIYFLLDYLGSVKAPVKTGTTLENKDLSQS